jgi:hypothetical protein
VYTLYQKISFLDTVMPVKTEPRINQTLHRILGKKIGPKEVRLRAVPELNVWVIALSPLSPETKIDLPPLRHGAM